MMMKPTAPVQYEQGPALAPADALLGWLKSAGERRLRVPVVLRFEDAHRLAIASAQLAARADSVTADAVRLAVDDGGLGVSLLDQLRGLCPADATACAVWLEGRWGALVPMPSIPGFEDEGHPFAVLKVGELVKPGEGKTVFGQRM